MKSKIIPIKYVIKSIPTITRNYLVNDILKRTKFYQDCEGKVVLLTFSFKLGKTWTYK